MVISLVALLRFAFCRKLVVLMALPLFLAGCNSEDYTWKQAISLVVDTPSGPVNSTTVQWVEVKLYDKALFASSTQRKYDAGGGPIVLDMGDGELLFGILKLAQLAEYLYRDLGSMRTVYETLDGTGLIEPRLIEFQYSNIKSKIIFFRFKDINDPASAELVDITDLAAIFGDGYALSSASLSITDAPIDADKLATILPWLATYDDAIMLDSIDKEPRFLDRFSITAGFEL